MKFCESVDGDGRLSSLDVSSKHFFFLEVKSLRKLHDV